MEQRRWLNTSQPQTLQIACFLLYFRAALALLSGGLASTEGILLIAGGAGAGFGIANEKKWGYGLGVAVAALPLALLLLDLDSVVTVNLVWLMLQVALISLLLHPQSRDYQRIWFK